MCADAEKIPLADSAVELVYSCFALQWCSSPETALREIARVLAPGGRAVIAVPVAGSLREFRESWNEVDGQVHFNALPPASQWVSPIPGLDQVYAQQLEMREHYADVRAVVTMLKATGANRVRREQPAGLMTPNRFQALVRGYEKRREAQGLPLSWQVLYLSFQKQG